MDLCFDAFDLIIYMQSVLIVWRNQKYKIYYCLADIYIYIYIQNAINGIQLTKLGQLFCWLLQTEYALQKNNQPLKVACPLALTQ